MSDKELLEAYSVKDTKILQKCIKLWSRVVKIKRLSKIKYKDSIIEYNYINYFNVGDRANNDNDNKKREHIIGAIVNVKIPGEYYKYSPRWKKLKKSLCAYIKNLCKENDINDYKSIELIHKASRKYHYDFVIIINKNIEFHVEFKFNAKQISDTPQFVSPMKPSQYLESSYEEYFYDKFFIKLCVEFNLQLPNKEEYLREVHSPKPKCLKLHQEKYYRGCPKSSQYSGDEDDIRFYKKAKEVSKESIYGFIKKYSLNMVKLNEYMRNTQKDKYYMLYKNEKFYSEIVDLDNYVIVDIKKDFEKCRYLATTKSDSILKILLRWKNGNGIAYPSFQIS